VASQLVFIDSSVLIAAARGVDPISQRALSILSHPDFRFASSQLVRLEVLPKALYTNRTVEADFYQAFFAAVYRWISLTTAVFDAAYTEAIRYGLSAIDSIHLVSAASIQAELFFTVERESKPLHRTQLIQMISITPESTNI